MMKKEDVTTIMMTIDNTSEKTDERIIYMKSILTPFSRNSLKKYFSSC